MEDRLTTVKTRKQQELIEIGKFLSTYESDCEKYREHKKYICKKVPILKDNMKIECRRCCLSSVR